MYREYYPYAFLRPQQPQNTRVRLRTDLDSKSSDIPNKRARRNTADHSAHSQSDLPDSPLTPASSDQSRWSAQPVSRPHRRPLSSTGTFAIPPAPRGHSLKGASLYPEPTVASLSSAGSSGWHSVDGGSSYPSFPSMNMSAEDNMATPKFAPLPPPPSLRRPNAPKPVPTKSTAALPTFRRRTTSATSATELLDHPQIKAALQRHKELSWKSLQEQVGGAWEPKGELKVMLGDGAPGNLMKRYSASEILDPTNWNAETRNEDPSETPSQRIWFQVRPPMKGANEVKTFRNPDVDMSDSKSQSSVDNDMPIDAPGQNLEKVGTEKLISASKELMINQLFPKYDPFIPGLPAGAIYLRHDHDRFEYRPYGWGHRDEEGGDGMQGIERDTQTMALMRTPSGTPGGRYIAPSNRRLLQWSLAQARWLFVLNEMPTMERPRKAGGYPIPDRLNSFLQQGEVIRRIDLDGNNRDPDGQDASHMQWEWVLPIRKKLWVSPMEDIIKKCGSNAVPVWDLGGRMLWDQNVGQWRYIVSGPTREIKEVGQDAHGINHEIAYDVCEGGRPRISWNDFMNAREYLVRLQRKISKLKARVRERSVVRQAPTEAAVASLPSELAVKREEDLDSNSNFSDTLGDHETSMLTGAHIKEEKEHGHDMSVDHAQHCASALLNMMMSTGKVLPSTGSSHRGLANAAPQPQENAMSLDLGLQDRTHLRVVLPNNGFGEITSGSPSLSPTASHASARRSISVEDDRDSPSSHMGIE
ncbi:hypothetical protein CPB86DRAFT_705988 [Serendipita vermifera]|nr:hypothetical protein CPB86DRAFT_705988 [Serendipita vermifera]